MHHFFDPQIEKLARIARFLDAEMFDTHANGAYSTVATAPSPVLSGTTLTVKSGDGALFPASPFVPYNAVAWPLYANPIFSGANVNAEIVRVTGRSSDTLTIVRAQEGTSAASIAVGWQISNDPTIKVFTDIEAALGAPIHNFIESGCVWTPDAAGSTKAASMTSGVCWINGVRLTVAAVTSRTFTASKDTYVDFQNNGDGTASITYTEVVNNSTSPALGNSGTTSNTIRNAIVTTGSSNIAAQAQINQGDPFAPVPPTAAATTTVAAGSNGNNITTSTLSVAANSLPAAGQISVAVSLTTTAVLQYTSGGGTTTLSGVTVISGQGTVATGAAVTSYCNNVVTDSLGNLVYPTSSVNGIIGCRTWQGLFSAVPGTTVVDVTGLALPFIVPPGPSRRVRVRLFAQAFGSTSATAGVTAFIRSGSTTLATIGTYNSAGVNFPCSGEYDVLLAPGSYTYKASISQVGASGTLSLFAGSTSPAYLSAELV